MAAGDIFIQRLSQQRLTQNPLATASQVVDWLGAVQSQDYLGAKWSVGLRMQNATDEAVEQAFTAGTMLRTHILRPTWHFVAPADIRWMEALTAPRIKAVSAYMYRQHKLDDALFARTNAVIDKALQGGRYLTRAELGTALEAAGIPAEGNRLSYIVMRAELDAVICSGPRRGKQFTYALLEERAPQARVLDRDEALAQLTRRYYTGHGPATMRDFAWWSGLSAADTKAGIDMAAAYLEHIVVEGQTYWFADSILPALNAPAAETAPPAFLLPTYDEFLVGYTSFGESRKGGKENSPDFMLSATVVLGGRVAGSWRRTLQKGMVMIEFAPFTPLTVDESEFFAAAASRYGDFIGLPVTCTIVK